MTQSFEAWLLKDCRSAAFGTATISTRGELVHFEIVVEDQSGARALEILVPRIVGADHTYRVHAYKGIGRIPKSMRDPEDASRRILLDNLPKLLRGYGNAFNAYPPDYAAAVVVVCDLDDSCLRAFRAELMNLLNACYPRPETRFCIAIEEGEAWFLGDLEAIRAAYPQARRAVLESYVNDSICGTWETLADAVSPGGVQRLSAGGWQTVGAEKAKWAEAIAPRMDVARNASPSFCYFRNKLQELADLG